MNLIGEYERTLGERLVKYVSFAYTELNYMRGLMILRRHNELDSTCGLSDEELTKRFKESVRIDNEIKKIKGLSISKYDFEKKVPYLEYPDGRREYA